MTKVRYLCGKTSNAIHPRYGWPLRLAAELHANPGADLVILAIEHA